MRVPISWLNEYVDLSNKSNAEIAQKLVSIGFEVEEIIYAGDGILGVRVGKILSLKPIEGTKLNLCKVDVGEVLTLVSGAPNLFEGMLAPVATLGAQLFGKSITKTTIKGHESNGMLCSLEELNIDKNYIDFDPCEGGVLSLKKDAIIGEDIVKVLGLDEYVLDVSVTANRPDCQSVYGLCRELAAAFNLTLKPLELNFNSIKASENLDSIKSLENFNSVKELKKNGLECKKNVPNCSCDNCKVPLNSIPKVNILDKDLCSRYLGTYVTNVTIKRSPLYIKRRLLLCKVKPINNVVDITNYVLLEVGQPLHAFDAHKIDGCIMVRRAKNGESIKALDGKTYNLNSDILVIADSKNPLAIAGIMGGEESAIYDNTTDIFLESARFARGNIRISSKSLALRSESSARNERGVDFASPEVGRRRALSLIDQLSAGTIINYVSSAGEEGAESKVINTSLLAIEGVLGIKIPKQFVLDTLLKLNFNVEVLSYNNALISDNCDCLLKITVPTFREDVDNFTDIAEEIIRFYGYDALGETMFNSLTVTAGGVPPSYKKVCEVENICCGMGAYEVKNYSFLSPNKLGNLLLNKDHPLRQAVSILNPLSEDYVQMRTEMVSSILSTAATNIKRQNKNLRIFEIDKVFIPKINFPAKGNANELNSFENMIKGLPLSKIVDERLTLCMLFAGEGEDFYTIKGAFESILNYFKLEFNIERSDMPFLHPGISADAFINGEKVGFFGEVHPTCAQNFEIDNVVYVAQLDLEKIINKNSVVTFTPLPKFPFVERDVAVVIDKDVPVGNILSLIKLSDALIIDVKVFDIYSGSQIEQGKKSVAFSVKLQSDVKTLVESEINSAMQSVYNNLQAFGGELRR